MCDFKQRPNSFGQLTRTCFIFIWHEDKVESPDHACITPFQMILIVGMSHSKSLVTCDGTDPKSQALICVFVCPTGGG